MPTPNQEPIPTAANAATSRHRVEVPTLVSTSKPGNAAAS